MMHVLFKIRLSKDKLLSTDRSACMQSGFRNLWFGFESKKLDYEPENYSGSRAGSITNSVAAGLLKTEKQLLINAKHLIWLKMTNSDFCVCILDKIQSKYRFKEFQKLLAVERAKAFKDFGNSCFGQSSLSKSVYDDLRKQAAALIS
jgi:hypothetical protein